MIFLSKKLYKILRPIGANKSFRPPFSKGGGVERGKAPENLLNKRRRGVKHSGGMFYGGGPSPGVPQTIN